MNVIDRSNYFRASLLLIRKDKKISNNEANIVTRLGKALGFEKNYCMHAIHEIMENEHVSDSPPKFSTKKIAKQFLKDGLTIAYSDFSIHTLEEKWLLSIAKENKINILWFKNEKEKILKKRNSFIFLKEEQRSKVCPNK